MIKCFCATTWLHANRARGIKAAQGTVASFQFVAEFFSLMSSPQVTALLSLLLGTVTAQVCHHKGDGSFFLLGDEAGNYIVIYNYSEAGYWDLALPCACKLVQVAAAVWAACPGHCWHPSHGSL